MRIVVETTPIQFMRYPTAGDYQVDKYGDIRITVADTGNDTYNAIIAIHELCEFIMLQHRGVTDKDVDAFDFAWEERRIRGKNGPESEPGFAADCPYRKEHMASMAVEMQLCAMMGINWEEYNRVIEALFKELPESTDDHRTISTVKP